MAIDYAVSQYKNSQWKNLLRLNLQEEEIVARIDAFKRQKQVCDLIEESHYEGLSERAFVIENDAILLPE